MGCVYWWIGTAAGSRRVVVVAAQHTRYKPVEKQLKEVEEEIFLFFSFFSDGLLILCAYQRHWRRPDINVVHILLQNVDRTTLKIIFEPSLNLCDWHGKYFIHISFYFCFTFRSNIFYFWFDETKENRIFQWISPWICFEDQICLFARNISKWSCVQWIKNAARYFSEKFKPNKLTFCWEVRISKLIKMFEITIFCGSHSCCCCDQKKRKYTKKRNKHKNEKIKTKCS